MPRPRKLELGPLIVPPVDPATMGHREVKMQAVVACEACPETRRKDQPWRSPCSRRDKEWPAKYKGE